jgi:hypothetical protein
MRAVDLCSAILAPLCNEGQIDMSSPQPVPTAWGQEASRPELDQVLATVLAGVTPVWIVEEQYVALYGPSWRVTLALPTPHGRWAQRRYQYDMPSQTLYFLGEQPLSEDALSAIRRTARRMA